MLRNPFKNVLPEPIPLCHQTKWENLKFKAVVKVGLNNCPNACHL